MKKITEQEKEQMIHDAAALWKDALKAVRKAAEKSKEARLACAPGGGRIDAFSVCALHATEQAEMSATGPSIYLETREKE